MVDALWYRVGAGDSYASWSAGIGPVTRRMTCW